jgi:hypothetical protein
MTITTAKKATVDISSYKRIIPFGQNPNSHKNQPAVGNGNNNVPPNVPPSGDSGGDDSNFCGKFLSDFAVANDTIQVKDKFKTISKFKKSIVIINEKFKTYKSLILKVKLINFVKIFNKSELYKKLLNESNAAKIELNNELNAHVNTINKALKQCKHFLGTEQVLDLQRTREELRDKLGKLDKIALNYKAALDAKFNIAPKMHFSDLNSVFSKLRAPTSSEADNAGKAIVGVGTAIVTGIIMGIEGAIRGY